MIYPEWRDHAKGYVGRFYLYAVRTWEPDKSAWETWCYTIVKTKLLNYMKKEKRYADRYNVGVPDGRMYSPSEHSPDALVISKEEQEIIRESIVDVLPDMTERQKYILWKRLLTHNPKTLQEIADKWGVTKQMISLDEMNIRNQIKETYDETEKSNVR
jgi:RNA polymerase sigma factor (sigma-70 family)